MRRAWLDRSPSVLLACCGCGWRDVAINNRHGWVLLADHLVAVHDDAEGRRVAQTRAAEHRRNRKT